MLFLRCTVCYPRWGLHHYPTPSVDSDDGVFSTVASSEVFADGEDDGDEEDKAVDSALNADFPDSQDLFLTLMEIPYQPSQGGNPDRESGEGSVSATVSRVPPASPSQRLAQIRRRKKQTRDKMFSELMQCSRTEAAQQSEWRETISQHKQSASEREERRDARENRTEAREDRRDARDDRWRQEDQRVTEALLGLMREQTGTLRRLVDVLQDRRQEDRALLQQMSNRPPPPQSPIAPSPRVPKRRGGRLRGNNQSTPADCSSSRRLSFPKF
ncbi:uncharacterized protein RBU57_001320 [Macrochelys suwanniensis]